MWKICLYFLAALVLSSCAKPVHKVLESKKVTKHIPAGKKIIYESNFPIPISSDTESEIKFTYLGCGGIFLHHQGNAVLFDPFFSNKKFESLPFKKIKASPDNINFGMAKVESPEDIKAIFISHAHYDHLFDTPYLLEHTLPEQTAFYGSESANKMIQAAVNDQSRLHKIEAGKWIDVASNIRVMPINSAHAPHFRFIVPIKLYNGKGKPIKGYNTPISETKAKKWKEGQPYSFLIDVRNENETIFRIFLQSSASDSPLGFPPEHVMAERDIDLAILGAASFAYTKNKDYPWEFLDQYAPKQLVICHWEDFFRSYKEFPKRFVRLTNFKKFLPKLYQQYPDFYLPEPGITINMKN